jgi:hypothetical protein
MDDQEAFDLRWNNLDVTCTILYFLARENPGSGRARLPATSDETA